MRSLQFWILLLGSSFVSILLVKQIFLNRALFQEQRELVDSQEVVSQAPGFENAWKQLAIHIYQVSSQDPALSQVLQSEGIGIQPKAPSGTGTTPATPPSASPASSKSPAAPPHPATP